MMEYILSLIIVLFQTLSQVLICSAFLKRKKTFLRTAIIFIFLVLLTFIEVNIFKNNFTHLKPFIYVFLLIIYLHIAFSGSLAVKFLCSVLSFGIVYAIDYATISSMAAVLGITHTVLLSRAHTFLISVSASCFVRFALAFIFLRIMRNRQHIEHLSLPSWIMIVAMPIFSVSTITMLTQISIIEATINYMFFISVVGILITNIALMLLITKVENDERIKKANLTLQQQLKYQMETADALMDSHTIQRKLTHDFKHHFSAINALLQQKNTDEAAQYVSDILKTDKLSQVIVNSHNPFVDAVLNQKYMVAKQQHILMEIMLNDLSCLPFSGEEIVVILSNLIDNSIESCLKLQANRIIRIKIMCGNNQTIISVANPTWQTHKATENVFSTTKSNKLLHGYGLQNVFAILHKYACNPAIEFINGWFQFSAIIFK